MRSVPPTTSKVQFSQQANGNAETYALRDLQIFASDSPPALYGPGDDLNTSPILSNVPIGQDNASVLAGGATV